MTYLSRVGVALSQLANTLRGGDPDETISSWLGKHMLAGSRPACAACRVLGWLFRNPAHCLDAVERDEGKRVPT